MLSEGRVGLASTGVGECVAKGSETLSFLFSFDPTRVGLYVGRLGGEGTTTAKLSLGTPSAPALCDVDLFDLSFDDDWGWV